MSGDLRCNIVTLGKTGAGKSTLLNYLFNTDFKAGVGKPETPYGLFPSMQEINGQKVCVFDSWGIEADKVQEWKALLKEEAMRHGAAKEPTEWFHAVVYCIQAGGGRVENIDAEIISNFAKDGYRVVVALTKIDQSSEEEEQKLKTAIHNTVGKKINKATSALKIISVCAEEKKTRMGITKPQGREELINAILTGWLEVIKNRLPSAIVAALQNKLNEFKPELSQYIDSQKISGRPEGNDDLVNSCRYKIQEKMEKLLTEDIKTEADRIIAACKEIGAALEATFQKTSSSNNLNFSDRFYNFFERNKEEFGKRMAGYIASLGIYALVREFGKSFQAEERNRIKQLVMAVIEDNKNILDEKLKPELEKFFNDNIGPSNE